MPLKKHTLVLISLVTLLIIMACRLSFPFFGSPTANSSETTVSTDSETVLEIEEQLNETEIISNGDSLDQDKIFIVPTPDDFGQCANVLFPLHPGMEWVYNLNNTFENSQIRMVVSEVNGEQATLVIHDLRNGHVSDTTVNCQDGAILNFPLVLFGSFLVGGDESFDLSYVDGYYVPNYLTFHNNNWSFQWTNSYLASGTFNTQINGKNIAANLQESPLTITWHIPEPGQDIFSPTQVAAGNFPDAIKLEQVLELDLTAQLNENGQNTEISGVLTLESQLWFQPYLGLLKQEVTQVSVKFFGVNLPIEFNSNSELVSYIEE
jgi:hypothetical protein